MNLNNKIEKKKTTYVRYLVCREHKYYNSKVNMMILVCSTKTGQPIVQHYCHAPSLHPIRGWQSETIAGPNQNLGLAYLLSGRLKHKRYNTKISKYLA